MDTRKEFAASAPRDNICGGQGCNGVRNQFSNLQTDIAMQSFVTFFIILPAACWVFFVFSERTGNFSEISGSRGDKYGDGYFLLCCAVWSDCLPKFERCLLPSS